LRLIVNGSNDQLADRWNYQRRINLSFANLFELGVIPGHVVALRLHTICVLIFAIYSLSNKIFNL